MSKGNPTMQKVFGDGSLFSPLLLGKYFDPSDAFPLWEFESEILSSNLRSLGQSTVDWFQTDQDYVLKAELQGKFPGTSQNFIPHSSLFDESTKWGFFWKITWGWINLLKQELAKTMHNFMQQRVRSCGNKWAMEAAERHQNGRRSGNWWEYGYVRKLERPEDADCRRLEHF
ncbi:hypothetical protein FNV43_RR03981 [Rhamnella rubrinervis]|uniref:Uncharacterized protein n=1 Tax=Rhamnella rubrinervis TaxID=2594499 RepID=A0A8K0HIQ0_9ROSA|nr:hypothetical protein FNV43_RR03981 [Rhamnella rubrinervis]